MMYADITTYAHCNKDDLYIFTILKMLTILTHRQNKKIHSGYIMCHVAVIINCNKFKWSEILIDRILLLLISSLQWRHNERNGVSNHQPHDCLLYCLLRRRSKKTSKLRVTGRYEGNSLVTGVFPAQRASNTEMFPLDDVIMCSDRGILRSESHWYGKDINLTSMIVVSRGVDKRFVMDPRIICRRLQKLGRQKLELHKLERQYDMCRDDRPLVREIVNGVGLSLAECQTQMTNELWNCSTHPRSLRNVLKWGMYYILHFQVYNPEKKRVCPEHGHQLACSCDNT